MVADEFSRQIGDTKGTNQLVPNTVGPKFDTNGLGAFTFCKYSCRSQPQVAVRVITILYLFNISRDTYVMF